MNKIIAIITIGAATVSLQLNAQDTKTTKEQANPEIKTDVLDERAQPSADYQHNQYGTYPQGDEDLEVIPQTKTEINRNDLPESVLSSFESSEYSNQEVVAIYEVNDDALTTQPLSNEVTDPTHHNNLNERSRVELGNNVDEESMKEITPTTQTETTLNEDVKEGNTIDPRSSDIDIEPSVEKPSTEYEIEVKDNDTNTVLTYSEEGELKNTSEESDM